METADLMNAPESELMHRIAMLEAENERLRAELARRRPLRAWDCNGTIVLAASDPRGSFV